MPTSDEHDWIFDFVLQFLESDKFDAAVMDFVDEKCDVFDNEEENKFIYTDIHREFRDHIEALISSNLGELGITPELFYESCEKGRNSRDINRQVFERMIAMDDFETFKKLMTKRNVELQLEAMRSLSGLSSSAPLGSRLAPLLAAEGKEDYDEEYDAAIEASLRDTSMSLAPLPDPEGLRELLEQAAEEEDMMGNKPSPMNEDEVQEVLRQSLMEMELMRHQQELEQAELERALALSLAVEEERLRLMYAEVKSNESSSAAPDKGGSDQSAPPSAAAVKGEPHSAPSAKQTAASTSADEAAAATADEKFDFPDDPPGHKRSRPHMRPVGGSTLSADAFAPPKPLAGRGLGSKPLGASKALPPIGSVSQLAEELDDKKRRAEEEIRRSQEQLTEQRKREEELRRQVLQSGPDEAERRAKHMMEQRDRIIAMKKAEREKRVRAEEERKKKELQDADVPEAVLNARDQAQASGSDSSDSTQRRRAAMRMALARRMKMDLIESEEAKLAQLQEDQFAELDRKLQQVEQLRKDNKQREQLLAEQLRRQQANIARNVQRSAAQLQSDN